MTITTDPQTFSMSPRFSLPVGLYSMPLHGKLILPLMKEEDSMTVSEPPGRVGTTHHNQ
jgi:hypothetical protein